MQFQLIKYALTLHNFIIICLQLNCSYSGYFLKKFKVRNLFKPYPLYQNFYRKSVQKSIRISNIREFFLN